MSTNEQNTEQQQCSERKIQANRENAQKSTGPKTEAGKAIVSRNSLKHGLLGKSLTLEGDEERAELEQFRADMHEELAPVGMLENMLVEEIVASWWKVQAAQLYSAQELAARRKASIGILRVWAASSGLTVNPFSEGTGEGDGGTGSGWECKELTIKVGAQQSENVLGFEPEDLKPRVQFEAKLSTSAETYLRYEIAWKKDMFRALEMLKKLQQSRLAKSGGSRPSPDSPNKPKSTLGQRLFSLPRSIFGRT